MRKGFLGSSIVAVALGLIISGCTSRDDAAQQTLVLDSGLTAREANAVERQIAPCWNVPLGAQDAEELVVELRLRLRRDGTVSSVEVVDTDRQRRDPFFRAAADSALRAVLNPRCAPFKLPADKYDDWKVMIIVFDATEGAGH